MQQVAVRTVKLHTVKACLFRSQRSLGKIVGYPQYLAARESVGNILPIEKIAYRRWSNGPLAGYFSARLTARMRDLRKNRRAESVDALRNAPPCRYQLIGVEHRHAVQRAFALLRDAHAAGDNEPRAASCIVFVGLYKLL